MYAAKRPDVGSGRRSPRALARTGRKPPLLLLRKSLVRTHMKSVVHPESCGAHLAAAIPRPPADAFAFPRQLPLNRSGQIVVARFGMMPADRPRVQASSRRHE